MSAPGTYRPAKDRWGRFDELAVDLEGVALAAVADARVLRLHPHVGAALRKRNALVVPVVAGERAKSLVQVERLARALRGLPRGLTLLAVGGGTVGDVATVLAHLFKRGVGRFIQVPTTLLAAVDSSVGGKGAVNVASAKNVLGVFHAADEAWLCPEVFTTLSEAQRREGRFEAWKKALCLDAALVAQWQERPPTDEALIRRARVLKDAVVRRDPYETRGTRMVLNFGHTFGHVLESVSHYRLRHGEAVGLGMLCALDVGRALGVTPPSVAADVEAWLSTGQPKARARLARALRGVSANTVRSLLRADKKTTSTTRMVLLPRVGRWKLVDVAEAVWRPLLIEWQGRPSRERAT